MADKDQDKDKVKKDKGANPGSRSTGGGSNKTGTEDGGPRGGATSGDKGSQHKKVKTNEA